MTQIRGDDSQDLVFENDRRDGKTFDVLSPEPRRIGDPFPIGVRLSLGDSSPCRRNLAHDAHPYGDRGRGPAWFGRNGASLNSQVQTTICFVHQPNFNARNVRTSHSSGDDFVQQALQRPLVSGVQEHLHRVVGIEPAITR